MCLPGSWCDPQGLYVEVLRVTVITMQQHFGGLYHPLTQVQVVWDNFSSMLLLQDKVWSEGTMLRWTLHLCGLSSPRAAGRRVTATSTPAAAPMDTSTSWEGETAAFWGISGGTASVRRNVAAAFFWIETSKESKHTFNLQSATNGQSWTAGVRLHQRSWRNILW